MTDYDNWKSAYPPEWDQPLYTSTQLEQAIDCAASTIGCDSADIEWAGDNVDEMFLVLTMPNRATVEIDETDNKDVDRAAVAWDAYQSITAMMTGGDDAAYHMTRIRQGFGHANAARFAIEAAHGAHCTPDSQGAIY